MTERELNIEFIRRIANELDEQSVRSALQYVSVLQDPTKMTNKEKMIARINRQLSRLCEGYVRDVMICADTLLDIQREKEEKNA